MDNLTDTDRDSHCLNIGGFRFKRNILFAGVFISVLTFLVYSNIFNNPFIFDDELIIYDYARKPWTHIFELSTGYRLLLKVSLLLNSMISGYSVWSYHLVNLTMHIVAGLFLFGIIHRTLLMKRFSESVNRSAYWLALISSTLWAVHPLQTESVTYIIQRGEVFMGAFYFATLYCLIRGDDATGKWKAIWCLGTLVSLGLGFCSKEAMISVIPIILLYDRIFLSDSWKKALSNHRVVYACLLIILIAPFIILEMDTITGYFSTDYRIKPGHYLISQPKAILQYLKLSFIPNSLCFDYAWPIQTEFKEVWKQGLIIFVLLCLTVWALIKYPAIGFLGAWFFINLAPRSSIIVRPDVVVEHRMYVPLVAVIVGSVMLVYFLIDRLFKAFGSAGDSQNIKLKKIVTVVFAGIVIMVFSVLTFLRNEVYQSRYILWLDTVNKSPKNTRALNYLGIELQKLNRHEEAKRCFHNALMIDPVYPLALNNIANQFFLEGNYDRALELYKQSILCRKKNPDDRLTNHQLLVTYQNMAKAYLKKRNLQAAMEHYITALEYEPENPYIHYGIANIMTDLNQLEKAKKYLIASSNLKPDFALPVNDLGYLAQLQGDLKEAERCFKEAIRIAPDYIAAHFNLGLIYNMTGRNAEALKQFRICNSLKPNDPVIKARLNGLRAKVEGSKNFQIQIEK